MDQIFAFSSKAFLKSNIFKIVFIYLVLVLFFLFVLWTNETLNIISTLVVLIVFATLTWFLSLKMIVIRSGCVLKINQNHIEYCFVKFNGTSSNLITERYEEDVYYIYEINEYNVSSAKIKIHGRIKKEERRMRNSNSTNKVKELKTIKIPLYFSGTNQIVQKLKEFQEVNYGQQNDNCKGI